jgi:hypothetical protein
MNTSRTLPRAVLLVALASLALSCRPLLNPWDTESPNFGAADIQVEAQDNVVRSGGTVYVSAPLYGSSSFSVTIRSAGPGTLELGAVSLTGTNPGQYTVTQPSTTSLATYGTTTITVTFIPTTVGDLPATVSIESNDPDEGFFDFTVLGTASDATGSPDIAVYQVATEITSGGSFAFAASAGSSQTVSFTVRNLGDQPLQLTGDPRVLIAGTDAALFAVTTEPGASVPAGSTTSFAITFSPTALASASATATIANTDPDENPFTFSLTGEGNSLAGYVVLKEGVARAEQFCAVYVDASYLYVAAGYGGLRIHATTSGYPLVGEARVGQYGSSLVARDVKVSGTYAYIAGAGGVSIVDVSTPTAPVVVGFCIGGSGSYASYEPLEWIALSGSRAYYAGIDTVGVLDVATPSTPTLTGSLNLGYSIRRMVADGTYLYVSDGNYGEVRVVDASDPANPSIAATIPLTGSENGLFLAAGKLYVARGIEGLTIVDVTTPTSPVVLGTVQGPPAQAYSVTVSGTTAYVGNGYDGMCVVDVAAPGSPAVLGALATTSPATGYHGLATLSGMLFLPERQTLDVIDVSTPASPRIADTWESSSYSYALAVEGDYVYVASWEEGLDVIDVSVPASAEVVARIRTTGSATDVVATPGYVYLASSELSVVDVSTPTSPAVVHTVGAYAYALALSGTWLYLAGDDSVHVVDVSVPTSAAVATSVTTSTTGTILIATSGNFAAAVGKVYPNAPILDVLDISTPASAHIVGSCTLSDIGFGWPRAIAMVGDYVYVAHDSGITIVDASVPASPSVVGSAPLPSGTSDAQALYVDGTKLYAGTGAVWLYDVSTPGTPTIVGTRPESGYPYYRDILALGNRLYLASYTKGISILERP